MAFYRCSGGGSAGTTNIFSTEASQTAFSANTGSRYINVPGKMVENKLIIGTPENNASTLSYGYYKNVCVFFEKNNIFYCSNSNIYRNCKFEIISANYLRGIFSQSNFFGPNIDIILYSNGFSTSFGLANFIGDGINIYIGGIDTNLSTAGGNVFGATKFYSCPNIKRIDNYSNFYKWFSYSSIHNREFGTCFEGLINNTRNNLYLVSCFDSAYFHDDFNLEINNLKDVLCTSMFYWYHKSGNFFITFKNIRNLFCNYMFYSGYNDLIMTRKNTFINFGDSSNYIDKLDLSYMFFSSKIIFGIEDLLTLNFIKVNNIICDSMFRHTNIYNIYTTISDSRIMSSRYIFSDCNIFYNTQQESHAFIEKLTSAESGYAFYNTNFPRTSSTIILNFNNVYNAYAMFANSDFYGTLYFNNVDNTKNIFYSKRSIDPIIVRTPCAYKFNNFAGDSILGIPFVWDVNQNDTKYNSMYKINIINTQ